MVTYDLALRQSHDAQKKISSTSRIRSRPSVASGVRGLAIGGDRSLDVAEPLGQPTGVSCSHGKPRASGGRYRHAYPCYPSNGSTDPDSRSRTHEAALALGVTAD